MTTVKAQGISKYEGTAWILIMDRNEGRKTNKIQKKSTERTNMEEKKLHKKHIVERGKNKIQLKKKPQTILTLSIATKRLPTHTFTRGSAKHYF